MINRYFLQGFEEIYTTDSPRLLESLGDLGLHQSWVMENKKLLNIPTVEEIKSCI